MNKLLLIISFIILFTCSGCGKKINGKEPSSLENKIFSSDRLNQWLSHRKDLKKYGVDAQIKAYQLERALLQEQTIIGAEKKAQLTFIIERSKYNKAKSIRKQMTAEGLVLNDKEVMQLYEKQKIKSQGRQDKIRLYQIFKRYPPNSDQTTKEQMYQQMLGIRKEAVSLDQFKILASQYSDSQSRFRNGLIGNVKKGLFPAELENIVFAMQAGEMSEVIRTNRGVMLFFCENRIKPKPRTEEQIMDTAKKQVKNFYFNRQWKSIQAETIQAQDIKINWAQLENENNKNIVTSKVTALNKTQLSWLFKGNDLKKIDKEKFISVVNEYILTRTFYEGLTDDEKSELSLSEKHELDRVLAQEILDFLIRKEAKEPSVAEINKYHAEHTDNFIKKPQYHISGLALKIEGDRFETYAEAENILNLIQTKDITIAQAADKYSVFNNKHPNGFLGAIPKDKLGPVLGLDLFKAVLELDVGQVSDLIETDTSYLWIIKLESIEASRVMTFAEAKSQVIQELKLKDSKRIRSEVIERLLDDVYESHN